MAIDKKFDAIIFDLDGTLWETIDCCMKANEYVRNKYPDITKPITREQVKKSMGKAFDEIVDMYYSYIPKSKATEYNKEAFNKTIDYLLQEGGTLYNNTKSTILELSKKYKLYIVSNCIEGYIESFLKTSQLQECFTDYESNGRTGLCKGDNIKLVIERNKIKNAVYIGDTIKDKEAADLANISFIYASYGFGNVEDYDYKIDDIMELINILK